MDIERVAIVEEDRQMVLLSLALCTLLRPGFYYACGNVADQFKGRDMFEDFRRLNSDVVHIQENLKPFGKRKERTEMDDRDLALRDVTKALDVLDDTLQQVSNVLLDGTASAEQRRRYALLQAAAVIWESPLSNQDFEDLPGRQRFTRKVNSVPMAIDVAEALLAEIEKREKAEAES